MTEDLIRLEAVTKVFKTGRDKKQLLSVKALDQVSLSIRPGETLGLVGESGSGKTTLGRIILGLEDSSQGQIYFKGQELTTLSKKQRQQISQQLQIIFQDPYSALNPRMTALEIVAEPLLGLGKKEALAKAEEILKLVGLEGEAVNKLPREFSGGQRQRIGIARAVINQPEFIVCDEPTSALDVSIQAQILKLLKDLQTELNLAYLFISHDLSVVRHISDRIAVLYHGKLVEIAPAEHLFDHPQHPYTQYLLAAKPELDPLLARQKLSQMTKGIPEFNFEENFHWETFGPDHFYRVEGEV
ncbi:ATP-binding cassette domain-containing protein [Streptococcus loxodontisalivarius]|uniref:ABC-type oligopeptide transport system ATPase subunit n=1 Tax=Streptococcus loxodontisalivarius TaxID=1349415 RepID=A0ABS2PSL0_9STRE|nr:ABC transporter ATP-binding protein [Streptococcus loxodontisalivarius]MBM7642911.1 ABC-type oligopeptide transport system ATPase subunit [Streptococcus loxodontisalivarius]